MTSFKAKSINLCIATLHGVKCTISCAQPTVPSSIFVHYTVMECIVSRLWNALLYGYGVHCYTAMECTITRLWNALAVTRLRNALYRKVTYYISFILNLLHISATNIIVCYMLICYLAYRGVPNNTKMYLITLLCT